MSWENLRELSRHWGGLLFVVAVSLGYGASLLAARMGYQASHDSHYHFAVAREIFEGNFRSEQGQHLPWTLLAELKVDHYFGYHALIAPFAALSDPEIGMKLATLTLFVGVFVAMYLFLRARGVAMAWVWALLPALFSTQDWRYLMLRGGHWMVPLSLLFLQVAFFVKAPVARRVGIVVVAYVAMLSYQGSVVLPAIHVGGLAASWVLRRGALAHGQALEPLLTVAGLALGLTLNPYMDLHASTWKFALYHVTYMNLDPEGLYPGLSEFGPIPLEHLVANPEYALLPLLVVVMAAREVARRVRGETVDATRAVLAGVALVGVVLAAKAIRMREYAVPWAFAFLAVAAPRSLGTGALRYAAPTLASALVIAGLWVKWPYTHAQLGQHLPTNQYRGARPLLEAHAGHPVLNVAEGDYTTLRWEYPDVACVQGLSRYFLTTNRPVFHDVWTLRDTKDPRERLQILSRFYDRGVRLLAVQHRNPVFRFAEHHPTALRPAYRSRFEGDVKIKGSSIYVLDGDGIQATLTRMDARRVGP